MQNIEQVIFYTLEKAIKSYRQFAQKNISASGLDITIDQWLVLRALQDHPELTQQQIANLVFKDFASVTRIIEILVQKQILVRAFNNEDRRRFTLSITKEGKKILKTLIPVIEANREQALSGLSAKQIKDLQLILNTIIKNCQ